VSSFYWALVGLAAIALNIAREKDGTNFPADGSCKEFSENLFWKSIINMWIVADIGVCAITMPSLVLNFYADEAADYYSWLKLLINTKKNALKKFYLTDDAKDYGDNRKLSFKLTDMIKR
jgi:hypothetical protein